jgi:hypothetical protein
MGPADFSAMRCISFMIEERSYFFDVVAVAFYFLSGLGENSWHSRPEDSNTTAAGFVLDLNPCALQP